MYFLKEQYSKTLTEVTFAKNSEGLSGMDRFINNFVHVKPLELLGSIFVISSQFLVQRLSNGKNQVEYA